jgi:hypothetical protein
MAFGPRAFQNRVGFCWTFCFGTGIGCPSSRWNQTCWISQKIWCSFFVVSCHCCIETGCGWLQMHDSCSAGISPFQKRLTNPLSSSSNPACLRRRLNLTMYHSTPSLSCRSLSSCVCVLSILLESLKAALNACSNSFQRYSSVFACPLVIHSFRRLSSCSFQSWMSSLSINVRIRATLLYGFIMVFLSLLTALHPLNTRRNLSASFESPLKNRGGAPYSAPPSP